MTDIRIILGEWVTSEIRACAVSRADNATWKERRPSVPRCGAILSLGFLPFDIAFPPYRWQALETLSIVENQAELVSSQCTTTVTERQTWPAPRLTATLC